MEMHVYDVSWTKQKGNRISLNHLRRTKSIEQICSPSTEYIEEGMGTYSTMRVEMMKNQRGGQEGIEENDETELGDGG